MPNEAVSVRAECISPTLDLLSRGLVWWLALLALLPGLPGAWTGVLHTYEIAGWVLIALALGVRLAGRASNSGGRPGHGRKNQAAAGSPGPVSALSPRRKGARTGLRGKAGNHEATTGHGGAMPARAAVWAGAALFGWLAFRTGQTGAGGSRALWMALSVFVAAAVLPRRSLRLFPAAFHTVGWSVLALAGLDLLGLIPPGLFRSWRDMTFEFSGHARVSGTFAHPNLLAFFLLAQWFNGLLVLRMRRLSGLASWPVFLFSFLIVLALSLTLSRAVLFGGLLILAAAGWRLALRHRPLPAARFDYLAAGAAALIVGFALTPQVWRGRIEQLADMQAQAKQALAASPQSASGRSSPSASQVPPDFGAGQDTGRLEAEGSGDSPNRPAVPALPRRSFAELERMSRINIWRDGLTLLGAAPVAGLGAGGYFRHGQGHLHAHNILLEIGVSGGAIGLILLALALWLSFRKLRGLRWWHVLLALPFATGIFDCFLFFNYPLLLTAFAFGLAARRPGRAERLAGTGARLALDGPIERFFPKTERQGRIVTAAAFLLFTGILAFSVPNPTPDFFAYYAATQYVNETGDIPYLAWPSRFEAPSDHPLAVFAMTRHGHQPVRFFYPPTALVLFSAIAWIPKVKIASLVWFGLEIGMVLLLAWGASRLSGYRGVHWLVLLGVLSHSPVSSSILFGQFSLPLAVLALWVWLLHRDGRSFAAGLLLAIGIAFKAYPLLWLGFLAVRPRGGARFLLGCGVGIAALFSLSVGMYGMEFWAAFHRWVLGPLNTYSPHLSMSARGLLGHLGLAGVPLLNWALLAGLTTLLATGGWKYRREGGGPDVMAAGVVAISVLASPVAWYHYACLITGFLAAFAGRLQREGLSPLVFVSLGLWFVTGLEFTGHALPQAIVRASLGFVLAALLPWLLLMLEGPDRVSWRRFIRREDLCHEPAQIA